MATPTKAPKPGSGGPERGPFGTEWSAPEYGSPSAIPGAIPTSGGEELAEESGDRPAAHPPAVRWISWLLPLLLFGIVAIRDFLPGIVDGLRSKLAPPPVAELVQSALCSEYGPEGGAGCSKTFSKSKDRQVFFLSVWRAGEALERAIEVAWFPPVEGDAAGDGPRQQWRAAELGRRVTRLRPEGGPGDRFLMVAELPLAPEMPIGEWKVAVKRGNETMAEFDFMVEP